MLHTRVILKGYNKGDFFVRESVDFGIDYQRDHSKVPDHPQVKERIDEMRRRYEIVALDTRDTN